MVCNKRQLRENVFPLIGCYVEPTSGLDSFNAQNVMQTLLQLAKSGRTVVTTIHQPRSDIFNMFDMLMLLSEGRVMYFGPAKAAVDYFASIGYP